VKVAILVATEPVVSSAVRLRGPDVARVRRSAVLTEDAVRQTLRAAEITVA